MSQELESGGRDMTSRRDCKRVLGIACGLLGIGCVLAILEMVIVMPGLAGVLAEWGSRTALLGSLALFCLAAGYIQGARER